MFRLKKKALQPIRLSMTPMIDIVFNLLIFFVMTFRIVAPEGDFNMRMPQTAAASPTQIDTLAEPIYIRLKSDSKGNLANVYFGKQSLGNNLSVLREKIKRYIGDDLSKASEIEVELDSDPRLYYKHTMNAITMISGEIDAQGNAQPLVQKIKFANRR